MSEPLLEGCRLTVRPNANQKRHRGGRYDLADFPLGVPDRLGVSHRLSPKDDLTEAEDAEWSGNTFVLMPDRDGAKGEDDGRRTCTKEIGDCRDSEWSVAEVGQNEGRQSNLLLDIHTTVSQSMPAQSKQAHVSTEQGTGASKMIVSREMAFRLTAYAKMWMSITERSHRSSASHRQAAFGADGR